MPSPVDGGKRCTCAPSVAIVLRLEAAPRLYADTADDWESSRLCDWVGAHADLAELLDRAIAVCERWERAA